MKKNLIYFLTVCGSAFFAGNTYSQLVTSSADDGSDGTLRQEILDTPDGGEITFDASVQTIALNSQIVLDKSLTITGPDGMMVTIDANSMGRIFDVTGGMIVLNNLNLQNGEAENGGGIQIANAMVTLNNSSIMNCVANGAAGSGGAVLITAGGSFYANNSNISNNIANRAGGGIEDNSGSNPAIVLNNVVMDANNTGVAPATAAPGNGGAIHITGPGNSQITGGSFSHNIAALEGGALWNGSGTMTVDGSSFTENMASGAAADNGGGALFNEGGTLIVMNATITNNVADGAAGSGGGILNNLGTLTVENTILHGNTASRAGGAIEDNSMAGGMLTLTNVTMSNNSTGAMPGNGGGLHITGPGDSEITGGLVDGNTAAREGGGLWNGSGEMTVNGTTITNNLAIGDLTGGGGIFNNGGIINIAASTTLTGNIAMGATPGGRGGAIFNTTNGVLNLANGLAINDNYASRAGGAIEDASDGTLTLNGITMTGNSAGVDIGLGNDVMPNPGNGGALHLSGTTNATISGFSTVSNNYAALEGGGLWNNLGTMTVTTTFIDGNIANGDGADDGGGGIFNNGGTLVVGNATIISNNVAHGTAGSGGGILSTDGDVSVENALIAFNIANRAGGGIELIEGSLTMSGNFNMSDNNTGVAPAVASPGNGGGLHITGAASATITGGTVDNNVAAREGGGLWNGTGLMVVDGTSLSGNIASGDAADDGGGAIFNNGGTLEVMNAMIQNNVANGTAGSGGGIFSISGDVTVSYTTLESNSANRAGGAVEIVDGNFDFLESKMINNDVNGTAGTPAPGNGGGFHATGMSGTFNFERSTITGNEAGREGGGLWNQSGSTMNVWNTTINDNAAFGTTDMTGGGGLFNNSGTLNIMVSTISGNTSTGNGGGIMNKEGGTIHINASTIALNMADMNGGGISGMDITLKNSIVALNMASEGNEVYGMITSEGFNIVATDDSGAFDAMGSDLVGVTPDLGPLADNGGPTMTHALLAGSVGVDAGDPADMFNDQRDFEIVDIRDIGAFEFGTLDACAAFKVYYINIDTMASAIQSTLYEVMIDGNNAELVALDSFPTSAHLGISTAGELYIVYGNGKLTVYDVATGTYSTPVQITVNGAPLMNIPHVVLDPETDEVFVASANTNAVYSVDPLSGAATLVAQLDVNVRGGDMIFTQDGTLWLINRLDGTFYNITNGGTADFSVELNNVNGAAVLQDGTILLANAGSTAFNLVDPNTGEVLMQTIETGITFGNGDLAAGCVGNGQVIEGPAGECTATEVVEYVQGTTSNGGPIASNRTNPMMALGEPEGTDELVFVTLGYGGSLILAFDGSIPNEAGDDIEVVETSFGTPGCLDYREYADVYVSQNGVNYFFTRTICKSDNKVDIDDAGQGFTFVNFVKIVNNDELTTTPDGFDVDGVRAIHNCEEGNVAPGVLVNMDVTRVSSMPNPSDGRSTVTFNVTQTGHATLDVYDMSGRNMSTLFNQEAQEGQEYRIDFEGSFLPIGIYLYRLTTGNETIVEKFLIAR